MRRRSTHKESPTGSTQTLTAAQTTGGDSVCVTTAAQMVGVMLTLASATRRFFQTTSSYHTLARSEKMHSIKKRKQIEAMRGSITPA
jgi:hypothetical protein